MYIFSLRGLVFDAEKGNILKLSGNGYILRFVIYAHVLVNLQSRSQNFINNLPLLL